MEDITRNIHRINGAILGLEGLKEKLAELLKIHKKKTKNNWFKVDNEWFDDLIDNHIKIYKNIKIKQLEKKCKEIKNDA